MIIDPGQLDRPISVCRKILVPNPPWNDVEQWVAHLSIWGMMKRVSENEIWAAHEQFAQRTAVFVTNWFSDIKETDKLVCEGIVYDVKGIGEIGRRDGLEIRVEVLNPAPFDLEDLYA